ncbi:Gag-pol protein [Camponotus japonicus]
MYRQILVDPRDRDFQRIVWYDKEFAIIQDYQLATVTYGTAAAPFLALRVLKQLVEDEGNAFPLAAPILNNNIYVDDVLFGDDDIPLLRQTREQLCGLLARGKFHLHKWASNNAALLADVSDSQSGNQTLTLEDSYSVLGLSWNPICDAFQFRVSLPQSLPNTKRKILSTIAKLFDPLGWVTPVTVNAKIFMQQLWRLKINWDDEIPSEKLHRWRAIYQSLSELNNLQISRWTGQGHETNLCELHGFSDASNMAYAAAVYMRTLSISGEIKITLLAGKSKVAPLKIMSIPRLELSAACLLARLIEFLQSSLNMPKIACYCWTDSTVVLAWLNSHPSRWKTFVSHRVSDIQSRIPHVKWRYISSIDNPADCASRGFLNSEFNSFELWWHGPAWLRLSQSDWPTEKTPVLSENIEENKTVVAHAAQTKDQWDLATSYSTWPKLIRVTAYVLRFASKCRNLSQNSKELQSPGQALTATECQTARQFWIRTMQSSEFTKELNALQLNRALPKNSPLLPLRPFLDKDGIIRVGGRLKNSTLSFSQQHPILLAPHSIVKLIIRHAHVRSLHAGVQLTLATVRQDYWILRARTLVKQVIHQCVPGNELTFPRK